MLDNYQEVGGVDQFEIAKNAVNELGKSVANFNNSGLNTDLAALRASFNNVKAEVDAVYTESLTKEQKTSLGSMKRTLDGVDKQITLFEQS